MSEQITQPRKSYFFQDPSHEDKARCLDCCRREGISPQLQNYAPATVPNGSCWECGETIEKMAVRRFRLWTAMGEGGAAIASLGPPLHNAAVAAMQLVKELAKQQRSTTSGEELQLFAPEALLQHQETWGTVCRLITDRADTVEATSRASFLCSTIMPVLENHLEPHAQLTIQNGIPSKRLFGVRTFFSPTAKFDLACAPIRVKTGETVHLNPPVDFGPIGPGDTEIQRDALVAFSGALESIAGIAEGVGPVLKRDDGAHAWRYLMQLVEEYGISPKQLAQALFDTGVDRSALRAIENKINVRLSQRRKTNAALAAPATSSAKKRKNPQTSRKPPANLPARTT